MFSIEFVREKVSLVMQGVNYGGKIRHLRRFTKMHSEMITRLGVTQHIGTPTNRHTHTRLSHSSCICQRGEKYPDKPYFVSAYRSWQ